MADIRPTASPTTLPVAPRGSARADTVRAAQAAFFQAALTEAPAARPAPAPVRSAPPTTTSAPASSGRVAFDPAAPAPARPLRPGSLLDIKV